MLFANCPGIAAHQCARTAPPRGPDSYLPKRTFRSSGAVATCFCVKRGSILGGLLPSKAPDSELPLTDASSLTASAL